MAALTYDGERGHDLSHIILAEGNEFVHDVMGSLFFHIHMFEHFMTKKYPEAESMIMKLCEELKNGKPTKKGEQCTGISRVANDFRLPGTTEDDDK